MPKVPSLSSEQIETFSRDGVLRLDGLLRPGAIGPAREAVLGQLGRLGLWDGARWTLPQDGRRVKVAREIGHRHAAVEALIEEPSILALVDDLLESRAFDRAVYKRPQILFSLPDALAWSLPGGWHTDSPRLASGERLGVQVFTFLEPVEARGGGTVVVAGSHRLLNDGKSRVPREVNRALRQEAFFRPLYGQAGGAELPSGSVGEVPLRVVELTGQPGDVWVMDLRVLHAAAPNATDRPRVMVTHRFLRADLMDEVAAAYGWAVGALRDGAAVR